jgi:hypothetical protein
MPSKFIAPLIAAVVVCAIGFLVSYDHVMRPAYAPTTAVWTKLAKSAPFDIRDSAAALRFGDKFILAGGFRASDVPAYRDIWSSTDGSNWVLEDEAAPIDDYATLVTDGERILALGPTVWETDGDLTSWVQISTNGPDPSGATGHAFWLADRIVYIGAGFVATSTDGGVVWEKYTPPFAPRNHHAATLHDGRIFIVGGADETRPSANKDAYYPGTTTFNDVWSSADGLTWELVSAEAPFSSRMWPLLESSKGRLILAQGFSNEDSANLGDVWMSEDGRDWVPANMIQPAHQQPPPRHFPSSYAFGNGSILVVAGNAWPVQNDAWRLDIW